MQWKTKARIQNAVALLPSKLSYATYYWLQRHVGDLRKMDPIPKFKAGMEIWKYIQSLDIEPIGKTFFEVGTGRVPLVPLSFWLMGADRTITTDLNPYLKVELLKESLDYIYEHEEAVRALFGPLLNQSRLAALFRLYKRDRFSIDSFFDLCQIKYCAPSDATQTRLGKSSVDFHTSLNVLEHIPPDVVVGLLEEGARIISEDGLFIHRIDYSDHFSHSDSSISALNFLQYSDFEWNKYADNRYMYMNRLRHDDFLSIFNAARHEILMECPSVDPELKELLLAKELSLDEKYAAKPMEVLSIVNAWIISSSNLKKA